MSMIVGAALAFAGAVAILPPAIPWNGASRALMVPPRTRGSRPPSAAARTTPRYDETVAWLRKLVAAAPELQLVSLGKSPEGRDIWMVIASPERAFTPGALRATGKPTLLAQARHPRGRDRRQGRGPDAAARHDRARHEARPARPARTSSSSRSSTSTATSASSRLHAHQPARPGGGGLAHQRAQPEPQPRLHEARRRRRRARWSRALDAWEPDLYFDLHVTDGADYQYDVTFGGTSAARLSPAIGAWLDGTSHPAAVADLAGRGPHPRPLAAANPVDPLDLAKGIADCPPRRALLDRLRRRSPPAHGPGREPLAEAVRPARARHLRAAREHAARPRPRGGVPARGRRRGPAAPRAGAVPSRSRRTRRPRRWSSSASTTRVEASPVTGGRKVVWSGKPADHDAALLPPSRPRPTSRRPGLLGARGLARRDRAARRHGIRMERLAAPREVEVTLHRLSAVEARRPRRSKGTSRSPPRATPEKRRERFPAGSVRVPTDQPLGDLAAVLLEPASPDSFFQWGFFNEVLQPTEYVEAYIMEPMAERMLAEDPALRAEYEQRVREDAAFAATPPTACSGSTSARRSTTRARSSTRWAGRNRPADRQRPGMSALISA